METAIIINLIIILMMDEKEEQGTVRAPICFAVKTNTDHTYSEHKACSVLAGKIVQILDYDIGTKHKHMVPNHNLQQMLPHLPWVNVVTFAVSYGLVIKTVSTKRVCYLVG